MEKKYNVIYADPPWSYKVWSEKGAGRSAESHYPTMSIEAIKALPVSRIAAGDCALFLLSPDTRFEDLDYLWGSLFDLLA